MQESSYKFRLGLALLIFLSGVVLDLDLNVSIAIRVLLVEGKDELASLVRLQHNDALEGVDTSFKQHSVHSPLLSDTVSLLLVLV